MCIPTPSLYIAGDGTWGTVHAGQTLYQRSHSSALQSVLTLLAWKQFQVQQFEGSISQDRHPPPLLDVNPGIWDLRCKKLGFSLTGLNSFARRGWQSTDLALVGSIPNTEKLKQKNLNKNTHETNKNQCVRVDCRTQFL